MTEGEASMLGVCSVISDNSVVAVIGDGDDGGVLDGGRFRTSEGRAFNKL